MIEFEHDPIHEQSAEKLRSLGIKAVIFDLDDTLIYTGEIFVQAMAKYVETISALTGLDPDILKNRIQELNDEEFRKMGVSPKRWDVVINKLAQEIGYESLLKDNLSIFKKIYTQEPRVRPGAKITLDGLRNNNLKIGMVTHASTEWTLRKLSQTGLLDYFDVIEVADENGFKTPEHWQKCMDSLNVQGHECLVTGDNLKGDIISSVSLGAKAIWIPGHWSVYREGDVPEGVVIMENFSDFHEAVQKLA